MNIRNSVLLEPWVRAFDFAGRSRRREYFIFYGEFIGTIVLMTFILGGRLDSLDQTPIALQIGMGMFVLLALIPGLSLHVRRLHDQNRSGWWILINAVPFVGHFILLVLMLWNGTPGDNRFGPNPRLNLISAQ